MEPELSISNSEKVRMYKIRESIVNNKLSDILECLCFIEQNTIILNYCYFKAFANNSTYNTIIEHITNKLDYIINKYGNYYVNVNMKGLTITEIDKHRNFIQTITLMLQNKYPNTLIKCRIHNTPSVFTILYKFVSSFIDKETLDKLELA